MKLINNNYIIPAILLLVLLGTALRSEGVEYTSSNHSSQYKAQSDATEAMVKEGCIFIDTVRSGYYVRDRVSKNVFEITPPVFKTTCRKWGVVVVVKPAPVEPTPAINASPVLQLPNEVLGTHGVPAAYMSYSVSATDVEDGDLTPSCSPASGSLFQQGDTTVMCSVTDSEGATTTGSFLLRLRYPTEPVPPVIVPEPVLSTLTMTWTIPTTRENGDQLPIDELVGYTIYWENYSGGVIPSVLGTTNSVSISGPNTTQYDFVGPAGMYLFSITGTDSGGLESKQSNPITGEILYGNNNNTGEAG